MPRQPWVCLSSQVIVWLGVLLGSPSPALAQGACLADVTAAAAGDLGYRQRGSRCEGVLKLFVSNNEKIEILGYHYGKIEFPPSGATLSIRVLGKQPTAPVVLRGIRLTSRSWYQMDSGKVQVGEIFPWPADVLARAFKAGGNAALGLQALALIACSNLCVDRPDTTYWPIELVEQHQRSASLTLLLRGTVRATGVVAEFTPTEGGTIPVPESNVVLTIDGVSAISLPSNMKPGTYKLTVTATEYGSGEPLEALHATIIVPDVGR